MVEFRHPYTQPLVHEIAVRIKCGRACDLGVRVNWQVCESGEETVGSDWLRRQGLHGRVYPLRFYGCESLSVFKFYLVKREQT